MALWALYLINRYTINSGSRRLEKRHINNPRLTFFSSKSTYSLCVCGHPAKSSLSYFFQGIRWFPVPNLVLKTIMMIKYVYGLEICVFEASSRGATSGLSSSAVFSLFSQFRQSAHFSLHFTTIKK